MYIEWKFKEWLSRFEGVDLPIGDLANDVKRDSCCPETEDYAKLHSYFESKGERVVRTFESVWAFYSSTK